MWENLNIYIYAYIFNLKNRDERDFRRSGVQEKALCGNKFQYVHLGFG